MRPWAIQRAAGTVVVLVGTAAIANAQPDALPAGAGQPAASVVTETGKPPSAAEDADAFLAPLSLWRRFRFDSSFTITSVRVQEGIDFEGKDVTNADGTRSTLQLAELSQEFEGSWRFKASGPVHLGAYASLIALGAAPYSGDSALQLPMGFRFGVRGGFASTFHLAPRVHVGARLDVSALGGDDISLNNAIASYDPSQPNDASRLYVMLVRPENQYTPGGAAALAWSIWRLDLQASVRFDYFITQRKEFVANRWDSQTSTDPSVSAAAAVGYRFWRLGAQLGLLMSDAFDGDRRGRMATFALSALPDRGRIQVSLAVAAAQSNGRTSDLGELFGVLRLVAYHR